MAAPTKSKVTPKYKTKYRVENWPAYEASLRQRGLDVDTPDHTTLSRRSATAVVPPPVPVQAGPIHLIIDSTGLKMVGDGEWHVLKHTSANKRRCWRKLHLGVDAGGFIVASELTESWVDDSSVGAAMIRGVGSGIKRFNADGAYDTRAVYEALAAVAGAEVKVVIPPRRDATPSGDDVLRQRDAAIAKFAEVGRRRWRKEAAAHQQARAENAMFRYKRIIGEALGARKMAAQISETRIAVSVLNRMTTLGKPNSVAVVP